MINELLVRITYRCDRNCAFCFNQVFSDKVNYDANEEMNKWELMDFIARHNIKKVHLSGGEPTMYKDIYALVSMLSKITKVSYFTNGLLFLRFTPQEIADMGALRIKVSLYNEELLRDEPKFLTMCEQIIGLKKLNPKMKFKASLMIDKDFFNVITCEAYNLALAAFDNIKWQPLTVSKAHFLYPTTLEAMGEGERAKIFETLRTFPDNKVEFYESVLRGDLPKACYMGRNYLTMNPDMSISLCPHLNEATLTIPEYEKLLSEKDLFFANPSCRTMRCISLQSFLERKYGGEYEGTNHTLQGETI